MKQLLMLVGVAAVAGAMYVAGASGSQQAKFASQKEVVALQKKVATMSKELKTVKSEADTADGFLGACFVNNSGNAVTLPVSQFGSNQVTGFWFGPPDGSNTTIRSALDVDASGSPLAYLQAINPACSPASLAARHAALHWSSSRLQRWAERTH